VRRILKWLFRCRHKWEANIYDGWECVEERCIKCNAHQHMPQFGQHGWQPGRLPKTHLVVIQNRNMGKTARCKQLTETLAARGEEVAE
jgi:hypothetical protein